MLQNVYFQQEKYKKADAKRIHIVDGNIYVIFINHLDHLKKIFHFLVVDSTKISQINTSLHQVTCQMLTFMFSLIVPEEMAYIIIFWAKFFICCKVTDPLKTVPWLKSASAKTIKLLISCLESNPIWVHQVD